MNQLDKLFFRLDRAHLLRSQGQPDRAIQDTRVVLKVAERFEGLLSPRGGDPVHSFAYDVLLIMINTKISLISSLDRV